MDNNKLVVVVRKLEERLSIDDRKRLHFLRGDNTILRLQENPSLRGASFLILSMIDQDKITDEEMESLIDAFNQIQCTDFAESLKQRTKRIQANYSGENSILLLRESMSQTKENDSDDETHSDLHNKVMSNRRNRNVNTFTVPLDDEEQISSQSKQKKLSNKIFKICLCSFLSIILIALAMGGCLMFVQLRMKCHQILDAQEKHDEIIKHLKIMQAMNEKNNKLLKVIQSISEVHKQDLTMIPTDSSETIGSTESDYNQTTQLSDSTASPVLTTIEFDEEDLKFTEGSTCGCAQWCSEHGSSHGVCGHGHTCICGSKPITKEDIGGGCTCDRWCRRHGYPDGGICGDGYTCICSK